MSIYYTVLVFALLLLLLAVLYYYILLAASAIPRRRESKPDPEEEGQAAVRFAVVIPAHNEESVISRTITSILRMEYDNDLFDVIVIADNCDDRTAELAKAAGAICFEREEKELIGKGHALDWFFRIKAADYERYDAFIIFDADSQPDRTFLSIMSSWMKLGYLVLQGQHLIANKDENTYTSLAEIGMRLTNRLRNLARRNLGLSCRLMGDAMCISRSVIIEHLWNTSSLVEDRDYGIRLIKNDIHILYVPEAISRGEAAVALEEANSQRIRWTGGVLGLRQEHLVSLITSGLQSRNLSSLDMALELVLPPYSVLVLLSLILIPLFQPSAMSINLPMRLLSYANAAAWLLIPVFGLLLDGASHRLYPYIFLGPLYTLWRIWTIGYALTRRDQIRWQRTRRSNESSSLNPKK